MENNKILFIAQEIAPYLPTTPLAELNRLLPQGIQEKGFEVRTFMPKYGMINERRNQLHEVIRLSGMNISIDDTDHPLIIKVATLQPSRMQVYFIDNEDYFVHGSTKTLETISSPDDNDERMIFFVRGVIETVKKLRWEPSVVNTVGWISALAPVYLRHLYSDDPSFRGSKLVVSLVNDSFDGLLDNRFIEKIIADGIDGEVAEIANAPYDYTALLKLAIRHADGVIQATPDISEDIIEYTRQLGKPFMPYASDKAPEAYIDFYNSL